MHPRFQKDPKPDAEVVQALEQALAAAKAGHVRAALIVTINPLHEPESITAGHLGCVVDRIVLIGALSCAAADLQGRK